MEVLDELDLKNAQKEEGKRETLPEIKKKHKSQKSKLDVTIPKIQTKETGTRDYSLILVVCEDARKTIQYLNSFKYIIKTGYVLEPYSNKKQGIPASKMLEETDIQVEKKGIDINEGDSVFLLSDVDHYRKNILSYYPSIIRKGYIYLISNPCIEVWFHYHYSDKKPNLEYCKEEDKYSTLMKNYISLYNKGGGVPHKKLLKQFSLDIPINNSKLNFFLEENGIIPELYSTQMHVLAEKIKDKIDNDKLEQLKQYSSINKALPSELNN